MGVFDGVAGGPAVLAAARAQDLHALAAEELVAGSRVVADALDGLPADLSAHDRDLIEKDLAHVAPTMSVEHLRRRAHRAVEVVDCGRADRIENDQLRREEAEQYRRGRCG